MKIALACQSVLLEKALKFFLSPYLASYKQCDFVISDKKIEIEKPLFFISSQDAHLNLPFSKSTLFIELEKFFNTLQNKELKTVDKRQDFHLLEEKIIALTEEFKINLVQTIKEFYEK